MTTADQVNTVSEVVEAAANIAAAVVPGVGTVVAAAVSVATDAVQRDPQDVASAINDAGSLLSLHQANVDRIIKAEELLADITKFLRHAFPTMFNKGL